VIKGTMCCSGDAMKRCSTVKGKCSTWPSTVIIRQKIIRRKERWSQAAGLHSNLLLLDDNKKAFGSVLKFPKFFFLMAKQKLQLADICCSW